MSIEGKHAYRFEYLKSDKWQAVRLEALVREKGKCQICGEESISNDAHHVWYPESVWDTEERHLVILCRSCHGFIHAMLPECKTNDEEKGTTEWLKFYYAILAWRRSKYFLFDHYELPTDIDSEAPTGARDLRKAYERIKLFSQMQCGVIADYKSRFGEIESLSVLDKSKPAKPLKPLKPTQQKSLPEIVNDELRMVVETLKKWSKGYEAFESQTKVSVDISDFQI